MPGGGEGDKRKDGSWWYIVIIFFGGEGKSGGTFLYTILAFISLQKFEQCIFFMSDE